MDMGMHFQWDTTNISIFSKVKKKIKGQFDFVRLTIKDFLVVEK